MHIHKPGKSLTNNQFINITWSCSPVPKCIRSLAYLKCVLKQFIIKWHELGLSPCCTRTGAKDRRHMVTNMGMRRPMCAIREHNFRATKIPERQGDDGLPSEQWGAITISNPLDIWLKITVNAQRDAWFVALYIRPPIEPKVVQIFSISIQLKDPFQCILLHASSIAC